MQTPLLHADPLQQRPCSVPLLCQCNQVLSAGIIAEEVVEPMPVVLKALCRRLVRWRILPPDREPDTAIVNVYDTGAGRAVAGRQIAAANAVNYGFHTGQLITDSTSSGCILQQHAGPLQALAQHCLLHWQFV